MYFTIVIKGEMAIDVTRKIEKLSLMVLISILSSCGNEPELTKAEQSNYNNDIKEATTSSGLSKADLAWHAQNTYGWDCSEVTSEGEVTAEGYFFIKCSSGKNLRVYSRPDQHPKITNENGGYN